MKYDFLRSYLLAMPALVLAIFFFCVPVNSANAMAWDFGDNASGSWDELDINPILGSGYVVIGNRWHATSTDATSICGFSSWWKKNVDEVTSSPILYFGYLPLGSTTGTLDDVTVLATSTVAGNLIGTSETKMDTFLPNCMTVNSGITWAIYYRINTTNSSYVTWYNDLGGDNHVQMTRLYANGTEYYSTGDLKQGMAQLITSEAPAVELPENCTWGIFCPLLGLLKSVAVTLFTPSSSITDNFNEQKEILANKVPFGYFTQVTDDLSSIQSATSTQGDLTFEFTTTSTLSTTTLTIIDISDLQENTGLHAIGAITKLFFNLLIGTAMFAFFWYEVTSHRHLKD